MCKEEPGNEDYITTLQLASFSSLYGFGLNVKGGLGLSHALGYALGSPYAIPHGITSCLTLASVVKLKAENPQDAEQIARVLPFIGQARSGDNKKDAIGVGDAIGGLLKSLGLDTRLSDYNVGENQISQITQLATGTDQGELFNKVAELVKSRL